MRAVQRIFKAAWRRVCLHYRMACRRHRRNGLTFSASAHLRARAGHPFWRNRIDGFFLLFFGQHQHSQASYQRGRAPPGNRPAGQVPRLPEAANVRESK